MPVQTLTSGGGLYPLTPRCYYPLHLGAALLAQCARTPTVGRGDSSSSTTTTAATTWGTYHNPRLCTRLEFPPSLHAEHPRRQAKKEATVADDL